VADEYGAVVSNDVKVKDVLAFTRLVQSVDWGDSSVEVFASDKHGDDRDPLTAEPGTVSFGGYEQYPHAVPSIPYNLDDDEDVVKDEDRELDLDDFVRKMKALLEPGEILNVFACGNEKLRYTESSQFIIPADGEDFAIFHNGSDVSQDQLLDLLALRGEKLKPRFVVVDTKVLAGGRTPVLGRFATEQQASEFIGTLPEHESGRYGLDAVGVDPE